MIKLIEGKDWSREKDKGIIRIEERLDFSKITDKEEEIPSNQDNSSNNSAPSGDNAALDDNVIPKTETAPNTEKIIINPYAFFDVNSSLFGISDGLSPINLGLYLDRDFQLYSSQFIGVMPLIRKDTMKPYFHNNEMCVIQINSRFSISPSEMLKEVLEGDDYYENPDMLHFGAYKLDELSSLFGKGEKNNIIGGTIKDINKVSLAQFNNQVGCDEIRLDPLLSSAYPIFEIIRFINLAKEVCEKNLKQHSMYKEENLVGKVKGRILIHKQIKHNLSRGQYQNTYCAYNALSEDTKENRILKYTLHLCSKFSIADSMREDIMFCNRVLANVPLKKCNVSDFVGLKSNSAFRKYQHAMEAAKRLLKRYYISYEGSSIKEGESQKPSLKVADYTIEPYFINMNLLFEYYCRALFRKAINKYNSERAAEYVLEMDLPTRRNIELFKQGTSDEEKTPVSEFYMTTYIPDILIRYKYKEKEDEKSKILTVIDAKYSDVEHSSEKRARTHQILFYMNVLNSDYGGLISPSKDGKTQISQGSFLYDGMEESTKKLCYIPLGEEKLDSFSKKILEYLNQLLEEKNEIEKVQNQYDEIRNDVIKFMESLKPENFNLEQGRKFNFNYNKKANKEKLDGLYEKYMKLKALQEKNQTKL